MGEVAAPVQAVQAPAPKTTVQNAFHLQRKCACGSYGTGGGQCDKCRKDGAKLQRAAARSQTDLAAALEPEDELPEIVRDVLRSTGQPLDPTTRAFLEPRFGHDFSNVRVHTDSRAAESARTVNALAYTVGRDVVFGAGQYAPNTDRGNRLLAHELTHVVQQSRGGTVQQPKAISEPSDAAEVEADATANRVMNSAAPVQVTQAPTATLHALTDAETAGAVIGGVLGTIGLAVGIAWLAGAFDKERFSDTELTAYLTFLATNRHIENHRDSDNKARDVVRRWRENDASFNIDNGFSANGGTLSGVDLKRLLIREMLSGVTAGADENAILTILENSPTPEIIELLDPAHGLSVQDIDDKVGGENHDRFEQLLENRLPRTGPNAAPQRRQTGESCTARQSLMVDSSRQRAVQVVNDALAALSRSADSDVAGAINCWFPSATPAQVNQVRGVLERVSNVLPSRVYHCGGEGGQAEIEGMVFTGPQGQQVPVSCISEFAASFGMRSGTGQNTMLDDVFLCAQFFRQPPDGQVVTIIHESVHATGITTDPNYNPSCGLSIATALTNPDSYAYLAMNLAQVQASHANQSGQGGQSGQSGQTGQVQRKASDDTAIAAVPEEVNDVLHSPGQSLDPATRAFMEKRFDRSFDDVRLHTDAAAADSARAVNAHAYTVGRDVVFGSGEYRPGTQQGTALLAHELTHVVQQQNHAMAAQQTAKGVSEPSDAAEVEAESVAADVLSGGPVQVKQAPNAAVHALTDTESGGVALGVIGGLGLIGVGIAALTGAFDFSRFRDCSPTWQRAINAAVDTAHSWIDNAVTQVDGVLRDPQNAPPFVVQQLHNHFKIAPPDTENLNRLRAGLAQIQAAFGRVSFECEAECAESDTEATAGYVLGFMGGITLRYGRIHLCPRWFHAQQADEQPETIAHEMAHRFVGARGDIYRSAQFNAYSALTTDQALDNADSYAQFARVLFNLTSMNAPAANQPATQPGAAAGQGGGGSAAPVQRKALGPAHGDAVPSVVDEALHTPGEPLDVETRQWLEPRFGRDFSDVRVHRHDTAAQSARAINAAAYTVGDDIVFGPGEYAPSTQQGAHLLAHELTHVAQQANGAPGDRAVSHPSDNAEVEAESVAAGVMSGAAVQVNETRSASVHAGMKPEEIGGVVGAVAGGAVLVGAGFAIAAAMGAFEKSKYSDCKGNQADKITAAAKVARKWLDDGLAAVEKVIASPKDAPEWIVVLLRQHFKIAPADKEPLAELRAGLSTLQSNFDRALFQCTTDCDVKEDSYRPGKTSSLIGPYVPFGRIQICTMVLEDGHEDELAETILHEMGHRYGGKNPTVEIYRKIQANSYFALPTEMALNNADSYAQFSKDVSNIGARHAEEANEEKEAEKSDGELKRKAIGAGERAAVPASVHEVLHSPGEPLGEETREWMEPRFAHDFGDVKVHADARAAGSARDVNAAAYTVGSDVVFGTGRYAPQTAAGRELLAHELTHVVQQRGHADHSPESLQIANEGEREADEAGAQIAHGDFLNPVPNGRSLATPGALQRQPEPGSEPAPESQPEPKVEAQPEQFGGVPVLNETAGMRGYPTPPDCLDVLWAREFERTLRLDTISVIALSARPASEKDDDIRAARLQNRAFKQGLFASCNEFANVTHPFRVRFYYLETDQRTPDRVKVNTEDARKNRELGDSLGASQSPRVSIYVERDSESTEDFSDAKTLTTKINKIIDTAGQSAAKRGAKKGLLPGYILGGLTSVAVGIGVGAMVAGGGASLGAAIGYGALAGALAGGAVIGLSAALGALFGYVGGTDRGTKELSKDRIKQVIAFVGVLRKAGEVKSKETTSRDADDLARDAVTLWIDNPAMLPLTVKDRRLLIKVMLDGPTLDDDERAIVKLLENSTDAEVLAILDTSVDEKERVTFQDLDDNIHGEEWQETKKMLAARFPKLGEPAIQREGKAEEGMCNAAQTVQIVEAIKFGTLLVQNGSQRLKEFLADPKAKTVEDIDASVHCFFKGATANDVQKIAAAYDTILSIFASRKFACLGNLEVVIPLEEDAPTTYECNIVPETAISMVYPGKSGKMHADRGTFFCPKFFDQSSTEQALTVVHEWVHQALASRNDVYLPKCDELTLDYALMNPDSYALLAAKLWTGGGGTGPKATGTPQVNITGFRNSGSPTPENRCLSCNQIPTLGVDPTTGANFMEVRGDITGHRPDAFYDFKRTKEVAIWGQLNDGTWNLGQYDAAGTLDDASADDEDPVPKFNQIFTIDGPGMHVPLPAFGDPTIKAGVYKGSFVESVNVKVGDGPWTPSSNEFKWHSLTWFERGDDGLLRRTPKNNEIAPGAITVGNNPPQP